MVPQYIYSLRKCLMFYTGTLRMEWVGRLIGNSDNTRKCAASACPLQLLAMRAKAYRQCSVKKKKKKEQKLHVVQPPLTGRIAHAPISATYSQPLHLREKRNKWTTQDKQLSDYECRNCNLCCYITRAKRAWGNMAWRILSTRDSQTETDREHTLRC